MEVHLPKVDKKSSCSINQDVVAQEADLQKSEKALTGQEHNQSKADSKVNNKVISKVSFKAQEPCMM